MSLSYKWGILTSPGLQGSKDILEDGAERLEELEGWEESCEMLSAGHGVVITPINP